MSKPTPGPWEIDTEDQVILATDKRRTILCWLGNTENQSVMANARLLAAAPDLLAALLAYDKWADATVCRDGELNKLRMQMRAAIAKAIGSNQ